MEGVRRKEESGVWGNWRVNGTTRWQWAVHHDRDKEAEGVYGGRLLSSILFMLHSKDLQYIQVEMPLGSLELGEKSARNLGITHQ